MSGQHAHLPPSGAAAWVKCPLWPRMNAAFPQDDTPDSMDGTAAHWAAECLLRGLSVTEGDKAPNGVYLGAEMLEAAQVYAAKVTQDLQQDGIECATLEQRVMCPEVHAHNWGTPDAFYWTRDCTRLNLYDFKFGHKFVDARENWQCINYALGLFSLMSPADASGKTVRIIVVQPRNYDAAGPIRTWEISGADLVQYRAPMRAAAYAAFEETPEAATGTYCEYCPGRHACTALQRAAYDAASRCRQSAPLEMPAPALALEYTMLERAAKLLDARVSGLWAEMETRAKTHGEVMPGYRVAPVTGRLNWSVPVPDVVALGRVLGVPLDKPAVITPTQAIKAGAPADAVNAFSSRETGMALIPDDGTAASRVFSQKME